MSVPVQAHVDEVFTQWWADYGQDTPIPPYRILLNGEPLSDCVDFNEATGTADVWVTDESGKTILFREDDPPGPRTKTVTGTIRLDTSPELRTWFEQHLAAGREKVA